MAYGINGSQVRARAVIEAAQRSEGQNINCLSQTSELPRFASSQPNKGIFTYQRSFLSKFGFNQPYGKKFQTVYPNIHDDKAKGNLKAFLKEMECVITPMSNGDIEFIFFIISDSKRNQFNITLSADRTRLSFLSAFKTRDVTWTAADSVQAMAIKAKQYGIDMSNLKEVELQYVSSATNTSLADDLREIQDDASNNKIERMEHALFTGGHAGKSVLRRLERLGYQPQKGTLCWKVHEEGNFGQVDKIVPKETFIRFNIEPIPERDQLS